MIVSEAWFFQKSPESVHGVVRDENGLLVCQHVSESDGELIASAPRFADENKKLRAQVAAMRVALSDVMRKAEGALKATKEGV